MSTSNNKYDALEQLIHEENIRIQTIDVHPEMDLLLVLLNTGSVLKEALSSYPSLSGADANQLRRFELIGKGTGIHWPELDEDLSLKGFLTNSLKNLVANRSKVA